MNILCVIPARSGSKGIKHKNIQEIGGKPLIGLAIEKALASSLINTVVLSTDSERYAEIGRGFGAKVPMLRPHFLSDGRTRIHHVLRHQLHFFDRIGQNYDAVINLQPTAPLLKLETIDRCISLFFERGAEAIGTGSKIISAHPYLAKELDANGVAKDYIKLDKNIPRYPRQLRPDLYYFNGCMFIRKRHLLDNIDDATNALGFSPLLFPISDDEAINIDEPFDLKLAKMMFEDSAND